MLSAIRCPSFYSSSEEVVCTDGELMPMASRALQRYFEGLISYSSQVALCVCGDFMPTASSTSHLRTRDSVCQR